jgi:hypothetical protein
MFADACRAPVFWLYKAQTLSAKVDVMRFPVILKKCISCLTLAGFTLLLAGCGADSTTSTTAPKTTTKKKTVEQTSSTTGPGKEEAEPKGRDVPDAAPADDKPPEEKPNDDKKGE